MTKPINIEISDKLFPVLMGVDGEKRLYILSRWSIGILVYSQLCDKFIRDGLVGSIESLDLDEKKELLSIVDEFMPNESETKRIKYFKAIYATFFIMQNT